MKILDVNSGRSAPPRVDPDKLRPLADGGAALLVDGNIVCATIEERHTRQRFSGGFGKSVQICMREAKITLADIDAIGHSTCCDIPWSRASDIIDSFAETYRNKFAYRDIQAALHGKVFTVDHHESHAMLAFIGSGFQRSLVAVIDGMGNRRGDADDDFHFTKDWWHGRFERHTIYLMEWVQGRVRIEQVYEECARAGEIGIGEIYRSATHYLGWPSYQYAGKTMALASFGDPSALSQAKFIEYHTPWKTLVPVANEHDSPQQQISKVLQRAGYERPANESGKADETKPFLCNVAALLQHQLEIALVNAIPALADKHNTQNLAIGGGVALNCVAFGKLAASRPDLNLYIPPAPGDTGQALGNALWLAYAAKSPVCETKLAPQISVAGFGAHYSDVEIARVVEIVLQDTSRFQAEYVESDQARAAKVVDALCEGKVIGIRQGRAEYGPRALGYASIVADPRCREMHDIVNCVKKRETFRPCAPSILEEFVPEYFNISTPSPFMSFAGTVKEKKRSQIQAVVHVDGTARYQSVAIGLGFYRVLLETFHERTGIPVILNTSFNLDGKPIVETPDDAMQCFLTSRLDALVLENWYIQKLSGE